MSTPIARRRTKRVKPLARIDVKQDIKDASATDKEEDNAKENQAIEPKVKGKKDASIPTPTITKRRTVLGELTASEVQARSVFHSQPENRSNGEESGNGDESRSGQQRRRTALPSQRTSIPRRPVIVNMVRDDDEKIVPTPARKSILRQQPLRTASATTTTARAKSAQRRDMPDRGRAIMSAPPVTASSQVAMPS